ncbi:hypothetical protein ABZ023_04330 [Streptomyces sp. NPDC006367]|uniref:hypothetical protein n=1 Tax=unclassified Streptomyces TaxID=2593676 RepID=UPI0033BA5185
MNHMTEITVTAVHEVPAARSGLVVERLDGSDEHAALFTVCYANLKAVAGAPLSGGIHQA